MRSAFYLQWRKSYQMMLALTLVLLLLIASFPMRVNALSSGALIALTNQQRAANGLAPLAYNGLLSSSAAAKARHMIALNYWSHNGPDGSTAWTFISNSGYGYITAGENLAKDFSSDGGVIAGWMASPSHRANILNGAYTDIGIAVVPGNLLGGNTTLIVAHYGASRAPAPKTAAPAVPVTPADEPASDKGRQNTSLALENSNISTEQKLVTEEHSSVEKPVSLQPAQESGNEKLKKLIIKALRPEKTGSQVIRTLSIFVHLQQGNSDKISLARMHIIGA